jgi:hypothetical protein
MSQNTIASSSCPTLGKSHMPLEKILDAFVHYYGVITLSDAIVELKRQFELKTPDAQLLESIHYALTDAKVAQKHAYFLSHKRVSSPGTVYDVISKSEQSDYKKIDAMHLKDFAIGQIPDYSMHHKRYKSYLVETYRVDTIAAHLFLVDIMMQMNLDWSQNQVMEHLPQIIKPRNNEENKYAVQLLALVYQHTPRWIEKGHTPHELYRPQEEMKRPEF